MADYYNAVDQILDESNDDNVILYDDENDKDVEFEQIALIPLDDDIYVILNPVTPVEGVGEGEALAFQIMFGEKEDDDDVLLVVDDEELLEKIFNEYYALLDEEEEQ